MKYNHKSYLYSQVTHNITFPFLSLCFKLTFRRGRSCPIEKACVRCIVSPESHGALLTLSCLCLHCVRSSDLWPLCLCLQITSEVHLFSHTKGKRHQQAVRDSSSIQGRELSDEEVVRITHTHTLTPCQEQTPTHPVKEYCCMCHVKKTKKTSRLSFMTWSLLLFMHPPCIRLCCRLCGITNGPWNVHS